jgi:hypothetical protein
MMDGSGKSDADERVGKSVRDSATVVILQGRYGWNVSQTNWGATENAAGGMVRI